MHPCTPAPLASCLSPPGTGSASIQVVVNRLSSDPRPLWSYRGPIVTSVPSPALDPGGGSELHVVGDNFGDASSGGAVTVGGRPCLPLSPPLWNHTRVVCRAPVGAVAAAAVVVTVRGTLSSPAVTLASYLPPVVLSVAPAVARTAGGTVLRLVGTRFAAHPDLGVSVALVRAGGSPLRLPCPLTVNTSTEVQCVVPEGAGVGYAVVLTNVDPREGGGQEATLGAAADNGTAGDAAPGAHAPFLLSYLPPVVSILAQLGAGAGTAAPSLGGFLVVLNGSNLSRSPVVTVAGVPCPLDPALSVPHVSAVCVAGPHLVGPVAEVVLDSGGQAVSAGVLVYDDPVVLALVPPRLPATTRGALSIHGANFGTPSVGGAPVPLNHTVTVGGAPCVDLLWLSDSELLCRLEGVFPVGWYNVTVGVAGQSSIAHLAPQLRLDCPAGFHGVDGALCQRCPEGGACAGGSAAPEALRGYFPLGPSAFVACVPSKACLGGNDGTCHPLYTGQRCAECALGAYRYAAATDAPLPKLAWCAFCGRHFPVSVADTLA
jgi:hypothetical protein